MGKCRFVSPMIQKRMRSMSNFMKDQYCGRLRLLQRLSLMKMPIIALSE